MTTIVSWVEQNVRTEILILFVAGQFLECQSFQDFSTAKLECCKKNKNFMKSPKEKKITQSNIKTLLENKQKNEDHLGTKYMVAF